MGNVDSYVHDVCFVECVGLDSVRPLKRSTPGALLSAEGGGGRGGEGGGRRGERRGGGGRGGRRGGLRRGDAAPYIHIHIYI